MLVSLDEVKEYLRIDVADEDALLTGLLATAQGLCESVARMSEEELEQAGGAARTAVLYAVAYLYEHREEADHHELVLTLRALMFGLRKDGF